jgi:hypothetical protein
MTRRELISLLQAKGIESVWGRGLTTRTKAELEEYIGAVAATEKGFARHLSHSAITEYRKCGLLYYFKRVDKKAPKFPPRPAMHYGRAYHRGLEQGLGEKMVSGQEPNESTMTDAFMETWRAGEDVEWTDEDRGVMEANGVALIKLYREGIIPDLEPTAVEDRYSVTFANRDWLFSVITDLEAKDAETGKSLAVEREILVDHKTASKSPYENEALTSEQLTAYAMAFLSKTGRIPGLVRIDKAVAMKGMPRDETLKRYKTIKKTPNGIIGIAPLEAERSQDDIDHYLRVMQAAADGIAKGVWLPPWSDFAWWCRPGACDFWQYCHEPK